jgi:hypothetical protein
MKSIALRLVSVGLVVGAVALALPSRAAASELDCTAGCALQALPFGSFGGTALFSTTAIGSTGTGVLDPFIRIQNDGMESGHNTSGTLVDDEKAGTWTHDLQLDHLPIAVKNGVSYYEFLLDANETGSDKGRLISLNNVQICVGATGGMTGSTVTTPLNGNKVDIDRSACPGTLKYSFGAFNSTTDNILLDYELAGSGSGKGDLFMYIPVATLGPASGQYVYLFSQFGLADSNKGDSDAGFEEWAIKSCYPNCGLVVDPHSTVPEPGSLLLLGAGVISLAAIVRRRSVKA